MHTVPKVMPVHAPAVVADFVLLGYRAEMIVGVHRVTDRPRLRPRQSSPQGMPASVGFPSSSSKSSSTGCVEASRNRYTAIRAAQLNPVVAYGNLLAPESPFVVGSYDSFSNHTRIFASVCPSGFSPRSIRDNVALLIPIRCATKSMLWSLARLHFRNTSPILSCIRETK